MANRNSPTSIAMMQVPSKEYDRELGGLTIKGSQIEKKNIKILPNVIRLEASITPHPQDPIFRQQSTSCQVDNAASGENVNNVNVPNLSVAPTA